jgi:raffinose/stachyose/melibiose transport system permease protein
MITDQRSAGHAETQPREAGRAGARARAGRRAGWLPYLFVAPALLFAAVFLYYPSVSALFHSFFDWDGSQSMTFIGLRNFTDMLNDPVMSLSFQNVLKLTAFGMAVELIVPLTVARLIIALRRSRAQEAFRVLFVIPLVVPLVVFYLMWQFIYDPTTGLLNSTLALLHLPWQPGWFGDPHLALVSLMFVGFPFVDGFGLLIYTAGLQAIPQEVLDAAQVDGAGAIARFFRVEIPLILGQIRLLMVLTLIQGIQQITPVLILTGGGPANLTSVPGLVMYNDAFYNNQFGYACAIGSVMFLIIMILSVLNLRFLRPSTEYDAAARA